MHQLQKLFIFKEAKIKSTFLVNCADFTSTAGLTGGVIAEGLVLLRLFMTGEKGRIVTVFTFSFPSNSRATERGHTFLGNAVIHKGYF